MVLNQKHPFLLRGCFFLKKNAQHFIFSLFYLISRSLLIFLLKKLVSANTFYEFTVLQAKPLFLKILILNHNGQTHKSK